MNCSCFNSFVRQEFKASYWENRGVTSDEIEILNFLKKNKFNFKKKTILHIGVGNSYMAEILHKFNCHITGLTISEPELIAAKLKKIKNYNVYLKNKYSRNLKKSFFNKKFDLVIDANLKSYACCNEGFENYFKLLISCMKTESILITSKKGMRWSKILEKQISFNFKKFIHFKFKEKKGPASNILSLIECKSLAKKSFLHFFHNSQVAFFKKN